MAIGKNLNKGKKEVGHFEQNTTAVPSSESLKTDTTPAPKDSSQNLHDGQKDTHASIEPKKMLVVFSVGEEEYALGIEQIKEVVPLPAISPVPQTKKYVLGVANVRGNVLAVVDMEERFGLKTSKKETVHNYVIVIDNEDVKVAIVSHHVPETLTIAESQIDSSADIMRKSGSEQNFIKGVIKKDHRMIIFIDILEMIENEKLVND